MCTASVMFGPYVDRSMQLRAFLLYVYGQMYIHCVLLTVFIYSLKCFFFQLLAAPEANSMQSIQSIILLTL